VYAGWKAAQAAAKATGSLAPPAHILNAPTKMMRELGYGAGYEYDHDTEEGFSGQDYFPEGMERPRLYEPKGRGAEAEIAKRLREWERQRR
jgi:putative ATPase